MNSSKETENQNTSEIRDSTVCRVRFRSRTTSPFSKHSVIVIMIALLFLRPPVWVFRLKLKQQRACHAAKRQEGNHDVNHIALFFHTIQFAT